MSRDLVAKAEDFTLEVDSAEWAALDIEQRTVRIIRAYADYLIHVPRPDEKEELLAEVRDERIREIFWEVWQNLPPIDRAVLEALRIKIAEGPLPVGTNGRCSISVSGDKYGNLWPFPEITIDSSQAVNDERMIETLCHELAHAAYRHIEIGFDLKSFHMPAEHLKTFDNLTEMHAIWVGKAWPWRARNWKKGSEETAEEEE